VHVWCIAICAAAYIGAVNYFLALWHQDGGGLLAQDLHVEPYVTTIQLAAVARQPVTKCLPVSLLSKRRAQKAAAATTAKGEGDCP